MIEFLYEMNGSDLYFLIIGLDKLDFEVNFLALSVFFAVVPLLGFKQFNIFKGMTK
jgi:hypothetical protein